MMTQTEQTTTVKAEDAPLGVQLWPTISPAYASNFTLESVEVKASKLRDKSGTYEHALVIWTYENGRQRTFEVGTDVAVQIGA